MGLRCAYCHEADTRLVACVGCGTRLHRDCWLLQPRCPTLGCCGRASGRRRRVRIVLDEQARRPARRRRPSRIGDFVLSEAGSLALASLPLMAWIGLAVLSVTAQMKGGFLRLF